MSVAVVDGPVAVLAGGPDAEHDVSLLSATAIRCALDQAGARAELVVIDRPGADELRVALGKVGVTQSTGVAFPALHGPFGEGGELQGLLEQIGVRFVGSGSRASRLAIDKLATKQLAASVAERSARAGDGTRIGVSPTWTVDPALGDAPPGPLPLAVKPNFEGSTVGLHICGDASAYAAAMREAAALDRTTIAEPAIDGHELTVGLLAVPGTEVSHTESSSSPRAGELRPLPLIHIAPADGLYDYAAKYERDDTAYACDPELPGLDRAPLARFATALARAAGARHLARADFIYDPAERTAWFLEINTMPGFTSHSLLPMAARHAGIGFGRLCTGLTAAAAVDHGERPIGVDPCL